jgi:hypothetical protein
MTREKAIDIIKCLAWHTRPNEEDIEQAIEALEQESSYNSVNSLAESKLKNPKAKTFDILHFVADNAGLSTFEAIEKAYNMGVSEQEPVLDKIRAEIKSYGGFELGEGFRDGYNTAMVRVLNILDKYKTETENT